MTIGEKIKERRKELGLSVEELANQLGKNRATIYRYEKNDIKDMPTTILEPLATALNTTPAYLMGWLTPGEIGDAFDSLNRKEVIKKMEVVFSKQEVTHFTDYIRLIEINMKKVDKYTTNLLSVQAMDEELAAAHERTDIKVTKEMKDHDDRLMDDDSFWEE